MILCEQLNCKIILIYYIRLSWQNTTAWKINCRSNMYRLCISQSEDIAGIKPQEIQNKFALPNTPKYICDVNLEVGTRLRTGEVNTLFGFDGGG